MRSSVVFARGGTWSDQSLIRRWAACLLPPYNQPMNAQSIEQKGLHIASGLMPSQKIVGDDKTDTALLRQMAVDAETFTRSFPWCSSVLETFWGDGIGGIFAVFLIHIRPSRPDVDPWIWIMVGDIPPAYLPLTDADSPAEAYRSYMRGMGKWVELARKGRTGTPAEGVPPVNVPSTPEWAERVNQKLYGLTLTVQPLFQDESDTGPVVVQ
jgi:hypothetical protein